MKPRDPLEQEEHTIEVDNPSAPNPPLVLIVVEYSTTNKEHLMTCNYQGPTRLTNVTIKMEA
jgi:hypothetical protein